MATQIATPRRVVVEGTEEWPDYQVIALGHLLAEGNLCHPHSVYFYSKDAEQRDDFIRAAEQFDNVACTTGVHREVFSVYARRVERSTEPGIVPWAKALGIWGENARQKHIPDEVFTLTNRQIGLLISRMWEGDGHIDLAGRSLFYATSSQRMARQLQHLLLRLGIISRLRTVEFPYKDGRIGYQLFVTGGDNLKLFRQHVACHFVSTERRRKLDDLAAGGTGHAVCKDVIPLGVKELVRAEKQAAGVSWLDSQCPMRGCPA